MTHELVSPTAGMIAYVRTLRPDASSLECAFAKACDAKHITERLYLRDGFNVDLSRMERLWPWVYLRDQAMMRAILEAEPETVLEFSAGFSPLGTQVVMEDTLQEIAYVETDLGEMVRRKREVLEAEAPEVRERLTLVEANVLDKVRILDTVKAHTGVGALTIVHQGLLQYLSHDEKHEVFTTIRAICEMRPWTTWITPDIVLRPQFLAAFEKSLYTRRMHEALSANLGRDMVACAFESEAEAHKMISAFGFTIRKRTQLELLGPREVATYWSELRQSPTLGAQTIWEMRLKQ